MIDAAKRPAGAHPRARAADAVLVAAFVTILALPLAANIAGHDGADPQAENRELAPAPRFGPSWSLVDYGSAVNRWFEDHFGFRAALVRWYAETRYFWLGVSPSSTVIKGRDGWLFYADDGAAEDLTNASPLAEAELEDWRETLVRTRTWLRARGIAHVFTMPPDKHVIYPEEIPAT